MGTIGIYLLCHHVLAPRENVPSHLLGLNKSYFLNLFSKPEANLFLFCWESTKSRKQLAAIRGYVALPVT